MGNKICLKKTNQDSNIESSIEISEKETSFDDLIIVQSDSKRKIQEKEAFDNDNLFPTISDTEKATRFSVDTDETIFFGRVKSVYDGDTFDVVFSFRGIYDAFTIRLYGIDCPEVKPRKADFETENERLIEKAFGIKVREYVKDLLVGNKIIVKPLGKDKYGRLLANILFPKYDNDGRVEIMIDLSDHLIEKGFGLEYFGGTKNKKQT